MSNEIPSPSSPLPATESSLPPQLIRLRRGAPYCGLVMIAWASTAILTGLLAGRPTLVIFYPLLLAIGWQAIKIASQFQHATPERTVAVMGRAYILQGWLFLLWIALGILIAILQAEHHFRRGSVFSRKRNGPKYIGPHCALMEVWSNTALNLTGNLPAFRPSFLSLSLVNVPLQSRPTGELGRSP